MNSLTLVVALYILVVALYIVRGLKERLIKEATLVELLVFLLIAPILFVFLSIVDICYSTIATLTKVKSSTSKATSSINTRIMNILFKDIV